MSRIFYDHLIDLDKVESRIKKIAKTEEERHELYHLIDDIVHHRVLGSIFKELPEGDHKEFVKELKARPHDKKLITYLQDKVVHDVEEFIMTEIHSLAKELLQVIADSTKPRARKAACRSLEPRLSSQRARSSATGPVINLL